MENIKAITAATEAVINGATETAQTQQETGHANYVDPRARENARILLQFFLNRDVPGFESPQAD